MKLRTLFVSFALVTASVSTAIADPAAQLRELDRLYKAGNISKAEYDRRWSEILESGIQGSPIPRVEKLRTIATPPWRFSAIGSLAALDFNGDEAAQFSVDATLGYAVLPRLELSAGMHAAAAVFDDDDEFAAVGGFFRADVLLLPSGKFTPYLGASYGWVDYEREFDGYTLAEDSDRYWSAHAGIRQYLKRNLALNYELTYRAYDQADLRTVGAGFGVTLLF